MRETMELAKHLSPSQILLNVEPRDKWELIDTMIQAVLAGPMCKDLPPPVKKAIAEAVVQRERLDSTGLGEGIAFPHGRIAGLGDWTVCLATLAEGLEFQSHDDKPVTMVCLAVFPEENPTLAIKILRTVGSLLSDETVRDFFRRVADPKEAYEYLRRKNLPIEAPILARDIMRPPALTVGPETPLKTVTARMHLNKVQAVPVVDEHDAVIGEITCDDLFCRGMPAFFAQLSSVAFIREFDPFEKYFEQEADSLARDVMSRDFAAVAEDDTLLEVMYQLSVKKHAKVYVLRDGRLVGIVDRSAVLDRVLNF
ncbi:MAG: PTS sugar transporter subunit IIA [Planctomycetes bacterium]|nr:PTS sugar transporter subunit IIA [Planctomycetota bacterium]